MFDWAMLRCNECKVLDPCLIRQGMIRLISRGSCVGGARTPSIFSGTVDVQGRWRHIIGDVCLVAGVLVDDVLHILDGLGRRIFVVSLMSSSRLNGQDDTPTTGGVFAIGPSVHMLRNLGPDLVGIIDILLGPLTRLASLNASLSAVADLGGKGLGGEQEDCDKEDSEAVHVDLDIE